MKYPVQNLPLIVAVKALFLAYLYHHLDFFFSAELRFVVGIFAHDFYNPVADGCEKIGDRTQNPDKYGYQMPAEECHALRMVRREDFWSEITENNQDHRD